MSVQDPITFDLMDLARNIAEEVFGEDYYQWYRDFGPVAGFFGKGLLVRPGTTINTDHLVFLFDSSTGIRVSVDQYGDIFIYKEDHPKTKELASYIADAKRTIIAREETRFVEAQDHIDIPDLSVRMAI